MFGVERIYLPTQGWPTGFNMLSSLIETCLYISFIAGGSSWCRLLVHILLCIPNIVKHLLHVWPAPAEEEIFQSIVSSLSSIQQTGSCAYIRSRRCWGNRVWGSFSSALTITQLFTSLLDFGLILKVFHCFVTICYVGRHHFDAVARFDVPIIVTLETR